MHRRQNIRRLVAAILAASSLASLGANALRVLDSRSYHLGTPGQPEWQEFEGQTPYGKRLDLKFEAQANSSEATLFLHQRDVKLGWQVQLNGKRIGNLVTMETPLVNTLAVPANSLKDGENTLAIVPPNAIDDIVVSDFRLDTRPLREALGQSSLEVQVTDADSKSGLPCRITITDHQGALAAIISQARRSSTNDPPFHAVRPGVVYSRDGTAKLGLLPGDYTVWATRGFEYGLSTQRVTVAVGQTKR